MFCAFRAGIEICDAYAGVLWCYRTRRPRSAANRSSGLARWLTGALNLARKVPSRSGNQQTGKVATAKRGRADRRRPAEQSPKELALAIADIGLDKKALNVEIIQAGPGVGKSRPLKASPAAGRCGDPGNTPEPGRIFRSRA